MATWIGTPPREARPSDLARLYETPREILDEQLRRLRGVNLDRLPVADQETIQDAIALAEATRWLVIARYRPIEVRQCR